MADIRAMETYSQAVTQRENALELFIWLTFGLIFAIYGLNRLPHAAMNQLRILCVDDDADLRGIVKDQLVAAGYVMDQAEDGQSAIQMLERGNYNLMLLDINMPGKSGIDVLKFIREKGLSCKVIMLTGRVGFSVATESLKLGADEYITKPFNMDYLLMAIKRVLGN